MSGGGENTSPLYAVFDLDGTLINVESAAHLAADREWDAFHDATLDCPPYADMLIFALMAQRYADVIVCTAKPERLRARVLNWLSMHGILPDALLMRPDKDFRPSPVLKLELMEEHLGPDWKQQILFAVEDRDKMVDAWRAAGITCLQCSPSLY
jgi:FMN phosphatase YigB (HAD superfamily)